MKKTANGLFISDDEIRALTGDRADDALAGLNANPDTQHKATMPAGKRDKRLVTDWLRANGFGAVTANMGEFGKVTK